MYAIAMMRIITGKGFLLTIFAMVSLSVALSGCRPDPDLEFIQGVWYFSDPHFDSIPGESHLESKWVFQRGAFLHWACCFHEAEESGWYRILTKDDTSLTLELFNMRGHVQGIVNSRKDTRELKLVIDREADTLKIGRDGPYIRAGP